METMTTFTSAAACAVSETEQASRIRASLRMNGEPPLAIYHFGGVLRCPDRPTKPTAILPNEKVNVMWAVCGKLLRPWSLGPP